MIVANKKIAVAQIVNKLSKQKLDLELSECHEQKCLVLLISGTCTIVFGDNCTLYGPYNACCKTIDTEISEE